MQIYLIGEFEDIMEDANEGDVAPLKCILISRNEDMAHLNVGRGGAMIGPSHKLAHAPCASK